MKSKVSFYILKSDSIKERDLYACRIIEKAFTANNKVYVYLKTQDEAKNFDKQLWTFRDVSFVPHEVYDKNLNSKHQILIGCDEPPVAQDEVLVNLSLDMPAFYNKFSRLVEVVPNDEKLKASARYRFHAYKKDGYDVETFDI